MNCRIQINMQAYWQITPNDNHEHILGLPVSTDELIPADIVMLLPKPNSTDESVCDA